MQTVALLFDKLNILLSKNTSQAAMRVGEQPDLIFECGKLYLVIQGKNSPYGIAKR
ncbi:hypothetical protein [Collimonas sp. OK307]|uniref:hypothetical protein n=1 Tax=Collimonas sp. OK307 TaxID=1801620 RepID=UPI001587D0D9|nr:hypothetical protein [Collimonas sp. OK307]